MGTYVRDALETDLLSGVDLATDGSDTGDAVEVTWPGHVQLLLETGTVSGTNIVIVQGCETSDFATADVVRLGRIDVVATDDDKLLAFETNVDARYVRAVVTIGTGGDMTGTTLKVVPPDYQRERSAHPTAAALA
jgi:hypothetical protein